MTRHNPTTENATMNAPTTPATVATVATATPRVRTADVGAIVAFAAPPVKMSPSHLRDVVEKRIVGDLGAAAYVETTKTTKKHGTVTTRSMILRDRLPDAISPVAALGLAVSEAVNPGKTRWVHVGQKANSSRWIFTSSDVSDDRVDIHGTHGAEARPNGDLVIDADVPAAIAGKLRSAYDAARALVEPSRVNAAIANYLTSVGAAHLTSSTYLVPEITPALRAVLAAVVDLGGFAGLFPVGSLAADVNASALVAPVTRSIEEEAAAVLAAARATIEKANAAAKPDGGAFMESNGETAHAAIDDVRTRLRLWRDRLGVALLDVEATLGDADKALDAACDAALEAVARRKAERAAQGLPRAFKA